MTGCGADNKTVRAYLPHFIFSKFKIHILSREGQETALVFASSGDGFLDQTGNLFLDVVKTT
ncbi:hypothetical protein CRI94_01735 [Longibacter salinarum]|uniref:Uncharacterized protein n=1 Tax=Longibacter salinarum TaxID=1850348 RepID=A0A2A8D2C3_9BACT|nr:hypothetical protein CRI94_01735 [Longibacter salinarum]